MILGADGVSPTLHEAQFNLQKQKWVIFVFLSAYMSLTLVFRMEDQLSKRISARPAKSHLVEQKILEIDPDEASWALSLLLL